MPGQRPVLQKSLTESASQEIIRSNDSHPLKQACDDLGVQRNNNFIGDDLRGDENQNFKFEYDELQVGLSFTSYDAACDYIKNWTDSNKLPLVKRDTSRGNEKTPGRLLFECPHAIKRRYKLLKLENFT